jgi:molecular chaperone DnaJ
MGNLGPGDLFVRSHIRPHLHLHCEGYNLIHELRLGRAEVAMGVKTGIGGLEGGLEFRSPPAPVTTRFELQGKGLSRQP